MVSESKMREILFRGKRLYGVGWAEGSLVVFPKTKRTKILVWNQADLDFDAIEVIPETVGQFTGLSDKNGKKVFENDIIVICYETDGEEFSETKKVHYNEKKCCWYPMRWEECCEHCDHYTEVKSIEVIGNIHDNPELLEVSHA